MAKIYLPNFEKEELENYVQEVSTLPLGQGAIEMEIHPLYYGKK